MQASAAARLPFMMVMHSTSDVAGICIDGWSGGERRQDEQGNCTSSDVEQRGRKVGCPGWARPSPSMDRPGRGVARKREPEIPRTQKVLLKIFFTVTAAPAARC